MKDFWRKHHKWMIPVIVFILIFFAWLVSYLNGIRFCYNPDLAITWEQSAVIADWIGAVATSIGVIVSGVAIFYAIRVPKEIAHRQAKIDLFNKRFTAYIEMEKHLRFSKMLGRPIDDNAKRIFLEIQFGLKGAEEIIEYLAGESAAKMRKISLLFPEIPSEACDSLSYTICKCFTTFYDSDNTTEEVKLIRQNYIEEINEFFDEYGCKILKEISFID